MMRSFVLRINSSERIASAVVLAAIMSASIGCGGDKLGRHAVSGTITYKGKPIPKGFVRFTPNTSKGTTGPGGGAPIENGKFHARANKGVVAGAYFIDIVGTDGIATKEGGEELKDGKGLFSTIRIEHDFPNQDSVWDHDVAK